MRDESDKDGMRMVIELRRGEVGDVVLNNLYKQTQMQSVFRHQHGGAGQRPAALAEPQTDARIFHSPPPRGGDPAHDFLLRKARERGHMLEGLAVALANIDPVIELIKNSTDAGGGQKKPCSPAPGPRRYRSPPCLSAPAADACRPDDWKIEFGVRDGQYYPVAGPGPGHPRFAPAPPDRDGARQADRRIPRKLAENRRIPGNPLQPGAFDAGDPRGVGKKLSRNTATSAAPKFVTPQQDSPWKT